jgi:hypothetical protein
MDANAERVIEDTRRKVAASLESENERLSVLKAHVAAAEAKLADIKKKLLAFAKAD